VLVETVSPPQSREDMGEKRMQSVQGADQNRMNRTVDFDSFSKILNRPGGFRDPGEPEEYCRGFQVFDKDMTGFIGVGQLRYSMFSSCRHLCRRQGARTDRFSLTSLDEPGRENE